MNFEPTQQMVDAAHAVFAAMAHEQLVRPIVEQYQRDILTEGKWTIRREYESRLADDGEVILDPKRAYLMSDADFVVYNRRCNEARDRSGLQVDHDEKCPLLVAENLRRLAEAHLVKVMSTLPELANAGKANLTIAHHKKFIDLTLALLAPFVKARSRSTEASLRPT